MYRGILVAVDGSEYSRKAAEHAAELARIASAKLVLFYAVPHPHRSPFTEGLDTAEAQPTREEAASAIAVGAHRVLALVRKDMKVTNVEERFVVSDTPYEAIIEAANKYECDLIVMAPHGHHGIAGVLLGSETQKVLAHSTVPVLVVH
jgi:nucleotide-binding universal stress UspA family protein